MDDEKVSHESAFEKNRQVLICRWKNSAVGTIASNFSTYDPVTLNRFSRVEKKEKEIDIFRSQILQKCSINGSSTDHKRKRSLLIISFLSTPDNSRSLDRDPIEIKAIANVTKANNQQVW
ncbi:hypothetical protein TNCV_1451111 [Trichonephila clavipes]|nr:hypothetical protein TNCV_1451111 [Trichonephila clavipes]